MPALRDPQWEKFAQELVALKKPTEAYGLAGYVPHRGNANRLARRPEVRSRVAELQGQAAELAEIQLARILVEIGRIGLFNPYPFLKREKGKLVLDTKGLPSLDFSRMTPEAFAAIAEIDPEAGKIKLHDKNAALFALLKHCGGLPEPEPAGGNVYNMFNMLDVDDQRRLVEALEGALGVAAAGAGQGARAVAGEHQPPPAAA